jgi:hypothetical protein
MCHNQILVTLNDYHRIQPLRWPSSEGCKREQRDHHSSIQFTYYVALHIQQVGICTGIALITINRELHQNDL